MRVESNSTTAFSSGKFTEAEITPSVLLRTFSIFAAQDAQLIPSRLRVTLSFSTLYPMDSIVSSISFGEMRDGSKSTFALPSSRLTATEPTPSFFFNTLSIFAVQAEQVIPETPRVISFIPGF